jgi:hypothetical protein
LTLGVFYELANVLIVEFKTAQNSTWEFKTDIGVTMKKQQSKTAIRKRLKYGIFVLNIKHKFGKTLRLVFGMITTDQTRQILVFPPPGISNEKPY